jgi:hypothetical protein
MPFAGAMAQRLALDIYIQCRIAQQKARDDADNADNAVATVVLNNNITPPAPTTTPIQPIIYSGRRSASAARHAISAARLETTPSRRSAAGRSVSPRCSRIGRYGNVCARLTFKSRDHFAWFEGLPRGHKATYRGLSAYVPSKMGRRRFRQRTPTFADELAKPNTRAPQREQVAPMRPTPCLPAAYAGNK